MIKRYRHWLGEETRHMVESFDGEYVLYTDHLAAIAEKDKEIEWLTEELDSHSWEISPAMAQQRIDKLWAENKRLERDILMLVRLCLSNGIISRGLACEYLGCAREDLDGILDQIATEAELEVLSQEEQNKFDNLSEGLQQTEKGEKLSRNAEDFADFAKTLEEMCGDLFNYLAWI